MAWITDLFKRSKTAEKPSETDSRVAALESEKAKLSLEVQALKNEVAELRTTKQPQDEALNDLQIQILRALAAGSLDAETLLQTVNAMRQTAGTAQIVLNRLRHHCDELSDKDYLHYYAKRSVYLLHKKGRTYIEEHELWPEPLLESESKTEL